MKNEELSIKLDNMIQTNHRERKEDRSTIEKLTDAISRLSVAQAETKIYFESTRKDHAELKLENEKNHMQMLQLIERTNDAFKIQLSGIGLRVSATERSIDMIKPYVKANTKSKDDGVARMYKIIEKLALFGILGGIAYKMNGGG